MLPGKKVWSSMYCHKTGNWRIQKGISLNIEQYCSLLDLLPQVEKVLKAKGQTVPRPQYDGASSKATATADDDEEDEEDEEEAVSKTKGKLDRFKMKKNHEATSDEDEDWGCSSTAPTIKTGATRPHRMFERWLRGLWLICNRKGWTDDTPDTVT
jgi:hypothetical protein